MAKYPPPIVPFVEARYVGSKQKPTAIFIKLSSTTSEKGAALGIANYHHAANSPLVSYHYIVDEDAVYQCVPNNIAAYGNPYRALNILVCAEPQIRINFWDDPSMYRVIFRTARLLANLIPMYNISVQYLDSEEEKYWHKRRVRRRGGLVAPPVGIWPYRMFLEDIKSHMKEHYTG